MLMRPVSYMRFNIPLLAATAFIFTFAISSGQTAPAIDLEARKASVANLESHIAQREARLEEIRQDVVTLDARIEKQREEVTISTGGATQQPSLDEAVDIGHLLDDARKDLRTDVTDLFRFYDEFARGRTYINGLKENLAARKAWLEKNAPAGN